MRGWSPRSPRCSFGGTGTGGSRGGPGDAAGIAAAAPGPRTKLTLKLDAEVVKWFRAMGSATRRG